MVLWRKRSVRILSTDKRKLGFNIQIFLEMEIPKTTVKLKGFMVCVMNAKEEKDKGKFDTSKKGLQFWQKHRDKQIKCNRVNKIKCINHVDKRCGTALRDLRDAWRGHKLPDGKAIGGKKNHLTEVSIKKLQVNYGKAIRSSVAPDVKTAKDHKDAVDKMKKAVMASFYHSIMLKDDKVRHQFCPSGDTFWCKFRRLGNMENAPHHLEPVFLDILEPLYDRKSDPEVKVIPEITRTGPLTICQTRLSALLYHARY